MIYFIQSADGPIKIGVTTNLQHRLRDLQIAHHTSLIVLGTMPGNQIKERMLHRQFARYRLKGEWFEPMPALLEYIRAHAEGGSAPMRTTPEPRAEPRAEPASFTLDDLENIAYRRERFAELWWLSLMSAGAILCLFFMPRLPGISTSIVSAWILFSFVVAQKLARSYRPRFERMPYRQLLRVIRTAKARIAERQQPVRRYRRPGDARP